MRKLKMLLMLAPLILAGCASQSKHHLAVNENGLRLYSSDSDQRMVVVKDLAVNNNHRICMTPQDDAVGAFTNGVALGAGAAGTKEGISFGKAKSELALGGRSPSVLISRELMYRACELASNLNADAAATMHIYERFLQALEKVALDQTETGTEPLTLAQTAQVAAIDTNTAAPEPSDEAAPRDKDDDGVAVEDPDNPGDKNHGSGRADENNSRKSADNDEGEDNE